MSKQISIYTNLLLVLFISILNLYAQDRNPVSQIQKESLLKNVSILSSKEFDGNNIIHFCLTTKFDLLQLKKVCLLITFVLSCSSLHKNLNTFHNTHSFF